MQVNFLYIEYINANNYKKCDEICNIVEYSEEFFIVPYIYLVSYYTSKIPVIHYLNMQVMLGICASPQV